MNAILSQISSNKKHNEDLLVDHSMSEPVSRQCRFKAQAREARA